MDHKNTSIQQPKNGTLQVTKGESQMKLQKSQLTNHHELREDCSIDCSSPIITDQSSLHLADINNIMEQYVKTGMLPNQTSQSPQFIDNTQIPNLEKAFEITRNALSMFNGLPAFIRNMMNNEPQNLESFITNPENETLLLKYGMITNPVEKTATQQKNTEVIENPIQYKKEVT